MVTLKLNKSFFFGEKWGCGWDDRALQWINDWERKDEEATFFLSSPMTAPALVLQAFPFSERGWGASTDLPKTQKEKIAILRAFYGQNKHFQKLIKSKIKNGRGFLGEL